ncbi:unnamed protein product [Musa acuminata subsp. burmannicoides]
MGRDSKPKESCGKGKGKQAASSAIDDNASKGKGKGGKSSDGLGTCSYGKGTQLLSTTMGAKEYVESEFVKAEAEVILPNKHLFPSAITSLDFLWAFGMLRSRAFSHGRGENLVLFHWLILLTTVPVSLKRILLGKLKERASFLGN